MPRQCTLLGVCACLALLTAAAQGADNELSAAEKQEGYVLLFDGKDLSGFRKDAKREYNKWLVQDGVVTLTPADPKADPNFTPYPLWTAAEYDNYVLKVDFRTGADPESGHSAVILRTAGSKPGIYPQPGIEVDIYGPARKPGYFCTGAFRYQVKPVVKSLVKPAGEWNTFVITVNKDLISVELNGAKVNELNLEEWAKPGKRPDGSGFPLAIALKDMPRKGPIGFRDDYGIPVWLKNIKIKPLP